MSSGVVQEILRNPWSGALFSERVRENTSVLAEQLNEVLTDSITRGRSWAQTSRELADRMGMGYREAERVVRTESVYVANAAEIESYKAAGIEKYRFLATLDMKTSRVCQEHDGEIFDVDKAVPGENLPPLHPNCRSTTTAVFDDMDMAEFERVAMDPVTGESYMVPANMTYPEWLDMQKEKYGVDVIDAERKKVLREAADKKQYRKYWAVLGKKGEFSSFANFQNLKYNNGEGWAQIKQAFSSKLPLTDFDRMKPLQGQWSDAQVRKWYVAHDRQIDRLIDSGATLERQARQAYEFRNLHRTQARDLMKDQEARKILDEKERNMTFEMLMEYKKAKYGLTGDEAYRDIVRSAGATRKSVDEQYGVD
jgi:SPP1 gp7 family putative phage head morphogenesis protein